MKVTLVNKQGLFKECSIGKNFWCLIFGPLVPLFRGDFLVALAYFLSSSFVTLVLETVNQEDGLLFILLELCFQIVIAIYFVINLNTLHIKRLIKKGYVPAKEEDKNILIENKIILN